MYSHPNLSQIKFLASLLAGLRGSGYSLFLGNSGFPGDSGHIPDIPNLKGIYTLFTAVLSFSSFYHIDRPPVSPRRRSPISLSPP
jgi:hypothetical protein